MSHFVAQLGGMTQVQIAYWALTKNNSFGRTFCPVNFLLIYSTPAFVMPYNSVSLHQLIACLLSWTNLHQYLMRDILSSANKFGNRHTPKVQKCYLSDLYNKLPTFRVRNSNCTDECMALLNASGVFLSGKWNTNSSHEFECLLHL